VLLRNSAIHQACLRNNNCCMYSCLVMVFYWLQRSRCRHYRRCGSPCFAWITRYTLLSPPHTFQTTKTLESPKWLIICVIEKQKVQSYDLRIVAWGRNECNRKAKSSKLWLADCCLVMACSWRILSKYHSKVHKWQDRHKKTHTHHAYGCGVKSSHNNSLLIARIVLTLDVCLNMTDWVA
jgi:hypothetical protein